MVSSSAIKSISEKENSIRTLFASLEGFGFTIHFLLKNNPFSEASSIKVFDSVVGKTIEKIPLDFNSRITTLTKSENDKLSVCLALFLFSFGSLLCVIPFTHYLNHSILVGPTNWHNLIFFREGLHRNTDWCHGEFPECQFHFSLYLSVF